MNYASDLVREIVLTSLHNEVEALKQIIQGQNIADAAVTELRIHAVQKVHDTLLENVYAIVIDDPREPKRADPH